MSAITKKYVDLSGLTSFKSEVSDLMDNKISAIEDFTGATSSQNGVAGQVPAPSAGDQNKFLRGDGEWSEPSFVGTEAEWNALSATEKTHYQIVNITDDNGVAAIDVLSDVSVSGVQCYKNGAIKQLTFDNCSAASIPNGFRPTVGKYLGLAYDGNTNAPVLVYATSEGVVTIQAMDATTLSTYALYGTLTYMY